MKQAKIFWFTGLSGAGKTTVADGVKSKLEAQGYKVFVLDGDQVRQKYTLPLGFSPEEIRLNNSLIARACKEQRNAYDVILVPIISPYRESRQKARELLEAGFYEIYFSASLECVVRRDVKGLYRKAKDGQIENLI